MGIFDFAKKKKPMAQEERSVSLGGLFFNGNSVYSADNSMNLSAVYCAVSQISNAIATLKINVVEYKNGEKKVIDHQLYNLLNYRASAKYNHFDFMKIMIESMLLRGNGYAVIERDGKMQPVALHYVDSTWVTPVVQTDGTVRYIVTGLDKAVDSYDMIDLHMHLDSQYKGISVIKYATMTMASSLDAEKHSGNFFKNGANLSGVLKASAPLTNEQKKQIGESWRSSFMENNGNRAAVAILPQGVDYQSISISPEDSQLLQSRQYNIIEIARWFCIPPAKLMVMDDVSYNSLEMAQIMFWQDTIYPYTELIEQEFQKLFLPSKLGKQSIDFDFSSMLSTNKESEANYYKTLLVNGILSPNEVRQALGFPKLDDETGDKHFLQISYGTMEDIASGAYIKQNAQSQTQSGQNDNKLGGNMDDNKNTKDTEEDVQKSK